MPAKVTLDDVSQQFLSADVEQAIGSLEVTRKIEDPKVRDARIERELADAKFERIWWLTRNVFAILTVFGVLVISCYMLLTPYTLEEKKLVLPVLTATAAALIGFVLGKSQNK